MTSTSPSPTPSESTGPTVLFVLGLIFGFAGIVGLFTCQMAAGLGNDLTKGGFYSVLVGVVGSGVCWSLDWLGEKSALKSAAADSTD